MLPLAVRTGAGQKCGSPTITKDGVTVKAARHSHSTFIL